MKTGSTAALHAAAAVYGGAVTLYGLHLIALGIGLLLGGGSLGLHGLYYVTPGAALCGLGIALTRGRAWAGFPAFLVSLVPGLWPLLWTGARYRSMVFLWSEILPLVAPAAFAVATILVVFLRALGPSGIAPTRAATGVYAAILSLHSLLLIWFGVWIFLYVHRHGPFEALYLIPGVILAVLSVFLWLGHAWPALPALAASVVPGIWPALWSYIAVGRTPVYLGWEPIWLLAAPASFATLTVMLVAIKVADRTGVR
jgi:hypothetical protein